MRILFFFIAIFSLSQSPGLARLSAAPPELISFWRLLAATVVMGVIGLFYGENFANFRQLRGKTGIYTLGSGLCFWLHLWCFQFAAQNTPIANVMIIFSTNPLYTGLISVFVLKIHFEKRLILAYLLSVIGIYILVQQNIQLDAKNTPGDLAALGAAVFFSFYILLGHQARKSLSNTSFSYSIYAIAGLCFFFTTWSRGTDFIHYPPITWMCIAGLVIFPTLLGHALFTYLLRFVNINWLSTGKLAEPILASISAYFLFNETWNRATLLAFSCTALSLVTLLQPWKHLRRRKLAP